MGRGCAGAGPLAAGAPAGTLHRSSAGGQARTRTAATATPFRVLRAGPAGLPVPPAPRARARPARCTRTQLVGAHAGAAAMASKVKAAARVAGAMGAPSTGAGAQDNSGELLRGACGSRRRLAAACRRRALAQTRRPAQHRASPLPAHLPPARPRSRRPRGVAAQAQEVQAAGSVLHPGAGPRDGHGRGTRGACFPASAPNTPPDAHSAHCARGTQRARATPTRHPPAPPGGGCSLATPHVARRVPRSLTSPSLPPHPAPALRAPPRAPPPSCAAVRQAGL